ncbi:MAG: hypothetical protein IT350_04205 [Deltaproteobacteria bacterium]|nr:hypothetical protein [Deltaproteobacteria bacterium]
MDIGSNTVRVLLADGEGGALRRVEVRRRITRLAGGFSGRLDPASVRRTVDAAREFSRFAIDGGASTVRAACTGVVRRADDRSAFLAALHELPGLAPCVISGNTEARLSAMGAAHHLGDEVPELLLIDIGGFSTELVVVTGGEVRRRRSFDLGVVTVTEGFLKNDPPTPDQIAAVDGVIENGIREFFDEPVPDTLVGIAGTATTLAAMDLRLVPYEGSKVHRHRVSATALDALYGQLIGLPASERVGALPGLEKGREDLIVAGFRIVRTVMRLGGFDALMVSEGGLLDGILMADDWPPEGTLDA